MFTMKKVFWTAIVGLSIGLVSCSKEALMPNSVSTEGAARASAVTAADAPGGPHQPPTPISVSALPTAITTAISASYAGATIERAGKDKEGNFVVLIVQASKPKGLLFSPAGVFQKELPPPPQGGHGGGPNSGTATGPGSGTGMGPGQGPRPGPPGSGTANTPPALTKIEVSALPATIKDYITSKYAGSEIKEAGKDKDGNFVVLIVQDSKPKGLLFNSAGSFQKELPPPPGGPGGQRPRKN